uniref:DUF4094 domain-containing protein n=1 Tax=Quercus lobata TaxID=97700 RepID=A0A7N2MSG3_QUELO
MSRSACIISLSIGFWAIPDPDKLDEEASSMRNVNQELLIPQTTVRRRQDVIVRTGDILSQVSQTHDVIMTLDKTISSLEMQLTAARAAKVNDDEGSPVVTNSGSEQFKDPDGCPHGVVI